MAEETTDLEKVPQPDDAPIIRAGDSNPPGYPVSPAYSGGYYGYDEDDEKVYLRRMWRAVWKRKWMMAVIAIIVTSVVTVQVFRQKSIYKASATIEIGKEDRTLVRSGDLVIQTDDSDDLYRVSMGMKTRMRLIQSRPLLEEVAARLKLDENQTILDVTKQKSVWEAVRTIGSRVSRNGATGSFSVFANPNEPLPGSSYDFSPEERAKLSPAADVLESNLSAEHLPDTRMLIVSFTHTDPYLAASVANATARVFIESNFESKTSKYKDTSEWLSRSTAELEARVEQAEQELANYSRANNIFSTQKNEDLTAGKLSRLHDMVTRAETDRILKQSLYAEVKAGRVAQLPDAFADAKIGALQSRLGELATKAAELDVEYGPKNPQVISVKQQMAAIQDQITESRSMLEEKLRADYERAVRDEASLRRALGQAKGEAVQQNQASIQYNILQQKVDTAKQLYTDFLQKTNQAKVQAAEQHNNLRLVDPARVPQGPIGPNRARTILIGFCLSLVAGFGLVLLLEYLDNTIKTVEDVNRYAQLPALSIIPAISRRSIRGERKREALTANGSTPDRHQLSTDIVAYDTRSSVAEAYRVLRTSVLLSSAGKPPKTILVTSALPGEGKTTTTINTAISLSQLGASVLIIDCDLRKPATHKAFGIVHGRGLTTYLSRDVEIDRLIQQLPIANLSLLTCGIIPPNPAEMISSDKMREMLEALSERYDHILIDSPPLMRVTDSVILSTMVDGVILVVHGGKSTRDVLRRARQELATVGAKVFGVVLNNVDLRREGYDDYYYDRYYSEYTRSERSETGVS